MAKIALILAALIALGSFTGPASARDASSISVERKDKVQIRALRDELNTKLRAIEKSKKSMKEKDAAKQEALREYNSKRMQVPPARPSKVKEGR